MGLHVFVPKKKKRSKDFHPLLRQETHPHSAPLNPLESKLSTTRGGIRTSPCIFANFPTFQSPDSEGGWDGRTEGEVSGPPFSTMTTRNACYVQTMP